MSAPRNDSEPCTDLAVYVTADGAQRREIPLPRDVHARETITHKGERFGLVARIRPGVLDMDVRMITPQDVVSFELYVEACRIQHAAGEPMPVFPNRRASDKAAA